MRKVPDKIEMVDDDTARMLRKKTGAERLAIAFGMFSMAREMLLNNLRAEHPDWSDEQVNAETARRMSHGAVGIAPPPRDGS